MMGRFNSTNNDADAEPTIACLIPLNSSGFEPTSRHQTLAKAVLSDFLEVRELDTGYALRYPNETASIMTLAEWTTMERVCCAFLDFTIQVEPAKGPVWLSVTGGTGVKEYLGQMLRRGPELLLVPQALDKLAATTATDPGADQAGMIEPRS
jgi:hypothetical protein